MHVRRRHMAGAVAVVTTLGFVAVLASYLPEPGYTTTRLVFFAVLGALAVLGTVGVVRNWTPAVVVASIGLVLLGFWQAVLWMYIVPMAGILVVCHLAARSDSSASVRSADS